MNTTLAEAVELVQALKPGLDAIAGVGKIICPPFISLATISKILENTSIKLGAQNMHFEDKGAYTGEISPLMLVGLCQFVIIGHSERRQYFGETDEIINRKIGKALAYNITPILCVGESLEDNEKNRTEEVLTRQIEAGLNNLSPTTELVIAYEPVWAIGTGKAATGKMAGNTIAFIRGLLSKMWNGDIAKRVRILYGGSVTSSNIADFVSKPEIDGALVGSASLKPEEFLSIVRQTANIKLRTFS
jgi:triosephosphate isomerase